MALKGIDFDQISLARLNSFIVVTVLDHMLSIACQIKRYRLPKIYNRYGVISDVKWHTPVTGNPV